MVRLSVECDDIDGLHTWSPDHCAAGFARSSDTPAVGWKVTYGTLRFPLEKRLAAERFYCKLHAWRFAENRVDAHVVRRGSRIRSHGRRLGVSATLPDRIASENIT